MPRRSRAPDSLKPKEFARLTAWCQEKFPWFERELPKLVEACLDHHGAKGSLMVDWPRTCKTWVRRQDDFHPEIRQAWTKRQRHERDTEELQAALEQPKREDPQLVLGMAIEPSVRPYQGPMGAMLQEILTAAARSK